MKDRIIVSEFSTSQEVLNCEIEMIDASNTSLSVYLSGGANEDARKLKRGVLYKVIVEGKLDLYASFESYNFICNWEESLQELAVCDNTLHFSIFV